MSGKARWVSRRIPTAAPFDVVPMMTYKKKKVARTSITKQDVRLYLPGLRSPKPLDAKPPGTQSGLPEAIKYEDCSRSNCAHDLRDNVGNDIVPAR